jgi:hypothetical protein
MQAPKRLLFIITPPNPFGSRLRAWISSRIALFCLESGSQRTIVKTLPHDESSDDEFYELMIRENRVASLKKTQAI